MSNARKLQTEIDRVMKKVDEGVLLFDEIWEKVYSTDSQNQKEKYEMDLKKEIKKLQRLRDQIKTWIGSSDVKDKEPLMDARRLIETKMEQFKICEKETKTKTYSKEGLARQEKLDPQEQAKADCETWIREFIDNLNQLVEDAEVEIERLSSGKGKKTNKHQIEECNSHVSNHKFHLSKLEGIIRLVNNDVLDVDTVNSVKDDLEYYMESFEDEDYQQAYDEDFFYEALGLDELDVVNVDRVTHVEAPKKKTDDGSASAASSKGTKNNKPAKKASLSSVIPISIGRARVSSSGKEKAPPEKATPVKIGRASSTAAPPLPPSTPAAVPATRTASAGAAPAGGASMAAILKRETEQQEKERQKLLREQQEARAQAEQAQLQQQQQLHRQQQEQLRQQEALRQQQAQAAQQEALKAQQQEALRKQQQEAAQQQQKAAQLQAQQQKAAAEQNAQKLQSQHLQAQGGQGAGGLDILSSGLGGLSLGGSDATGAPVGATGSNANAAAPGAFESGSSYLTALNDSFANMPSNGDGERSRHYTPQNPYPTPASYPGTPSAIFENPAVFEKLGTDCLFFIFYYSQGTYQQYLAARELKKQSWRFHKKYMTWFQRHEEPKVTTDEYEQGTYVYFDYETGWCTRIKTDFRFEYSFLEDSLQ